MKFKKHLKHLYGRTEKAVRSLAIITLDLGQSIIREVVGLKQPLSSIFETAEKILEKGIKQLEKNAAPKSKSRTQVPEHILHDPRDLSPDKKPEATQWKRNQAHQIYIKRRLEELVQLQEQFKVDRAGKSCIDRSDRGNTHKDASF